MGFQNRLPYLSELKRKMPGLYIITTFVLISVSCLALFRWKKEAMEKQHQRVLISLADNFNEHQAQIHKRQTALHRYDFLRYNLSEVIVKQPEIILDSTTNT